MALAKVVLLIGTRPEAIKMAPVVHECKRRQGAIETIVCLTGQHREMLVPLLDYFSIPADVQLDVMRPDQSLSRLTSACISGIDDVLAKFEPRYLVGQGDTTTVMAASLAAFYRKVPFVHVEAGLRTGNLMSPWPEELNRRIVDLSTALYCAPTKRAYDQLISEGVSSDLVRITGNTVVDALYSTIERERLNEQRWSKKYQFAVGKDLVLITGHRRENHGAGIEHICRAIAQLSDQFGDAEFIYPVHLNPNVQEPVFRLLANRANVHLLPPLDYPEFVWLMDQSKLVLSDSGGIQEECAAIGKPIIVTRDTTERPEAQEMGISRLVGCSVDAIVDNATSLLAEDSICSIPENCPYGDGTAAIRIVDWMLESI